MRESQRVQEQPHKRHGIAKLVISLVLIAVAVLLFLHRQFVIDQLTVWQYKPSAEILALADNAKMNDNAKFYFYASQPEINDRDSFNRNCTANSEQTVVLGCYASQRIYVFNVTDERLEGIKEVTAAHEMLHAAYDRLSRKEKDRVNGLLETQLSSVDDQRIKDLIAIYDKTEPGERLNELHSIFATELVDVSDELEAYYANYFTDRAAIVALSKSYESVFADIKQQQASLLSDLNNLADRITSESKQYNQNAEQLNSDISSFNQRANNNGYSSQSAFDADRAQLVTRQQALADQRTAINNDIALYNQKRNELEALNGQAQDLNDSINSNALEPTPSL